MDVDATTTPPRRLNVALAWTGMLLASALPAIIWDQFARVSEGDLRWMPPTIWAQVAALTLLCVASLVWRPAQPMRLPLIMLAAFLVGWRVLTPLVTETASWSDWQAKQSIGMSLATSRLQWLPPAVLMTLVALAFGLNRQELFLAKGDWRAPVSPSLLFPLRGWKWFPGMLVLFLLLTLVPLFVGEFVLGMPGWVTSLRPDFGTANRVLVHFPGVLAGSALNAIFEEYIFRIMLLACFIRSIGTKHALLLTSVLFALEHWPTSGFAVIHTFYWGWLLGKSMIETRGCSWAIVQHIIGDIPIYALVAMAKP
jgi:membrane protease YdiL (CAAX protease family)